VLDAGNDRQDAVVEKQAIGPGGAEHKFGRGADDIEGAEVPVWTRP
jgi:hypothetical protein